MAKDCAAPPHTRQKKRSPLGGHVRRGCCPSRGLVPRKCPLCSRRLEPVGVGDQQIHCCAHCSIAWRPGLGTPPGSHAATGSGKTLVCPDCGDRVLTYMGATARGEEWRCLGCHGRLVRVAGAAESPPPQEPSGDGEIAGLATQALSFIAEVFLG
jgi:hypothetical protein